MRSLLIVALTVPSMAFARTADKHRGEVDAVQIGGVVDVPLLRSPYGDEMPYVWVKLKPDDTKAYLFGIDMGSSRISFRADAAEDMGFKIHTRNKNFWASMGRKKDKAVWKLGGKVRFTNVDQLILAEGLVLEGVEGRVYGEIEADPLYPDNLNGPTISGYIGVGALPMAVALLPSQGIVRFAPAEQATELLAQVGPAQAVTPVESSVAKTPFGKEYRPPAFGTIPVEANGQTFPLEFSTSDFGSVLPQAWNPGDVKPIKVGDIGVYWTALRTGALDLGSHLVVRVSSALEPREDVQGEVGYNYLRAFDIAVDPVNRLVSMAPATAQKRAESLSTLIAQTDQEILDLDKPPEDGSTPEAKTEEEQKAADKKRAGLLESRATLERMAGQVDKAIADLDQAIQLNPNSGCPTWADLGYDHLLLGHFTDALTANQKGLDLYQTWASISAKERKKVEGWKEEKQEAEGYKPQDLDACDYIYSQTAYLNHVTGHYDVVQQMYDHLDLHGPLARVVGTSLLAQGKFAEASGPYRQALRLAQEGTYYDDQALAREGLIYHYKAAGDIRTALDLWYAGEYNLAGSPLALDLLAELVRLDKGEAAVAPALAAVAAHIPFSAVALWANGDIAGAEAIYVRELAYEPNSPGLLARYAYFLARTGRPQEAQVQADKALLTDPAAAYAFLAKAWIARAAGNQADMDKYRTMAIQFASDTPVFAMLPAMTLPPPPAPVPVAPTPDCLERDADGRCIKEAPVPAPAPKK